MQKTLSRIPDAAKYFFLYCVCRSNRFLKQQKDTQSTDIHQGHSSLKSKSVSSTTINLDRFPELLELSKNMVVCIWTVSVAVSAETLSAFYFFFPLTIIILLCWGCQSSSPLPAHRGCSQTSSLHHSRCHGSIYTYTLLCLSRGRWGQPATHSTKLHNNSWSRPMIWIHSTQAISFKSSQETFQDLILALTFRWHDPGWIYIRKQLKAKGHLAFVLCVKSFTGCTWTSFIQ